MIVKFLTIDKCFCCKIEAPFILIQINSIELRLCAKCSKELEIKLNNPNKER